MAAINAPLWGIFGACRVYFAPGLVILHLMRLNGFLAILRGRVADP